MNVCTRIIHTNIFINKRSSRKASTVIIITLERSVYIWRSEHRIRSNGIQSAGCIETHIFTMLFKCLLLLFVPSLCFGQNQPSIWRVSPQQAKSVGESVEFECFVNNTDEYPVSWMKTSSEPAHTIFISRGWALTVPDSRYSVLYTRLPGIAESHVNKLQIQDLNESDSGTYQCMVLLSIRDRITADVELTVQPASARRRRLVFH